MTNPNDLRSFVSARCAIANARGFTELHAECTGAPAFYCHCDCHRSEAASSTPGAGGRSAENAGVDDGTPDHASPRSPGRTDGSSGNAARSPHSNDEPAGVLR